MVRGGGGVQGNAVGVWYGMMCVHVCDIHMCVHMQVCVHVCTCGHGHMCLHVYMHGVCTLVNVCV
jgi:hypothetical protein